MCATCCSYSYATIIPENNIKCNEMHCYLLQLLLCNNHPKDNIMMRGNATKCIYFKAPDRT